MHTIFLVLACLACAGQGRREKVTSRTGKTTSTLNSLAESQESEANARAETPNPVKVLAMLLAGFGNPADAFALPNARSVEVPGQRLAVKDPNGIRTTAHSAAQMKEKRVPWDWKRFIQQSSKFVDLPLPFKRSGTRLLAPGDSFGQLQFFPLDDVVMGGASASTFDIDSRKWTGNVTDATSLSSGGFVGIRAKTLSPLDLTNTKGIVLKLRPDGKKRRFKFSLRDNSKFNGITWTTSFTIWSPLGMHTDMRIPYSSLVPTLFAKTVPGAKIDLTNIVATQLTLSKFEYNGDLNWLYEDGAFEMEVLDVATY